MKSVTKNLRIIVTRSGMEIPIENERLTLEYRKKLDQMQGFIHIDGEDINIKDIVGTFKPDTVDAMHRRKRGEWQDENGQWYSRDVHRCPGCGNIIPKGKVCGNC